MFDNQHEHDNRNDGDYPKRIDIAANVRFKRRATYSHKPGHEKKANTATHRRMPTASRKIRAPNNVTMNGATKLTATASANGT